jgi:hypothetical protein
MRLPMPLAAPVHVLEAGARGQERAVEMDGEHLLPLVVAELLDRLDDLDAGIRNEDVDLAVCAHGRGDARIDLGLAGHVHLHAGRGATGGDDRRGHRIGRIEVEVGDCNCRPVLRIDLGDALADAACRAGDQSDLASECHGNLLKEWGKSGADIAHRARQGTRQGAAGSVRRAQAFSERRAARAQGPDE